MKIINNYNENKLSHISYEVMILTLWFEALEGKGFHSLSSLPELRGHWNP
jgi:hypothetical protein